MKWAAFAVFLLLAGCASPQVVTERVEVYPPASLYPDCAAPEQSIETNGDLARAYRELRASLRLCREAVEALREWPTHKEQVSE